MIGSNGYPFMGSDLVALDRELTMETVTLTAVNTSTTNKPDTAPPLHPIPEVQSNERNVDPDIRRAFRFMEQRKGFLVVDGWLEHHQQQRTHHLYAV